MDGSVIIGKEADDILQEGRDRFAESASADSENRIAAAHDLKFLWNYENFQWPQDAQRVRKGRPMLVENRLPQFVRQVVNNMRRNRPAIQVTPVDSQADPKTADIMEGLIRHIEQYSRADMAYDEAGKYAVSCGVGYFRITTEYASEDGFDQEICIKPIPNPLTVYDDQYCKMPDKSDRRYCFVSEMVKRTEFKAKYGFEPTAWEAGNGEGDDMQQWFEEDAVRVAEYWRVIKVKKTIAKLSDGQIVTDFNKKQFDEAVKANPQITTTVVQTREVEESKVEQYLMTGDKIIRKSEWLGKYIPLVYVGGEEMDIEGKRLRKSLIRDAIDSQRAINYYESAKAEVISLTPKAPYIGPTGAFDTDADKWETTNTENYAYLQYDGQVGPQRQQFTAVPMGLIEAKMQAIEAMKSIIGIHDASLGARSNETSGIAIRAREQQGDTQTFHFIDNVVRAIRYAGLCIIDLAPKVYDAARVIRALNPDGSVEKQLINQMFIGPDGQLGTVDLSIGKYDVVVTAGPSYQTQRQESRDTLIELTKAMPIVGQVAPDLIAKNMDFPEADELARRLKATIPPQIIGDENNPLPPEVQQAMQQAQQMMQQAQQAMQQAQQAGQMLQQEQAKTEADKAQAQAASSKVQDAMRLLNETERRIKAEIELFAMKQFQPPPPPPDSGLNNSPPSEGFFSPEV